MAEQNKILERIKESKIIAIVRGIPSSSIVDLWWKRWSRAACPA